LSFLKKLIRKKEEKVVTEVKKTELEELCGDDKETYEALLSTMFLDPREIRTSIGEAEEKAKEFENSGDRLKAVTQYQIAGRLAISEGDVEKVKKFFGKCQELSETDWPILKIPEKAVAKAQEYYKKYLKE